MTNAKTEVKTQTINQSQAIEAIQTAENKTLFQQIEEKVNLFNQSASESPQKSVGVEIAELILDAFKADDTETIKAVVSARQTESWKKANKSYVSKAFKVGQAMQEGFIAKTDERTVTSLYAIVNKLNKENKEKADEVMLKHKLAEQERNQALMLALNLDTVLAVHEFEQSADPETVNKALEKGKTMLAEAKEQESIAEQAEQAANATTQAKALADKLASEYPELFMELKTYINSL